MPGVTVNCPQCQQKIINASPGGDGFFHCSGCGNRFGDPAENTGSVLTSEQHPEPSGRPPEQTSYGLLSVTLWLLFIYLLAATGFEFWSMQGNSSLLSNMNSILRNGTFLLMAFLGILTVIEFSKLDSRAAWIAWRCGALKEPLADPAGSSLRYILPLSVFGGITIIFASQGITNPQLNNDGSLIRIGTATAGGIALFLAGLACGELRRFFWRMSTIGAALCIRPQGEALGLNVNQTPPAIIASRSTYIFRWMCVAVVVYFVWSYVTWQSRWISGAHAVYVVTGLLAFLLSFSQLMPLFRDMIENWRLAGNSIASPQSPAIASHRWHLYCLASLTSTAALGLSFGVIVFATVRFQPAWSFKSQGIWLALGLSNLFVNLWLIELYHDCCMFANGCMRFSKARATAPTLLTWVTRVLCVTAALYMATVFGSHLYYNWSAGTAWRNNSGYWNFISLAISQTVQTLLTVTLPAIVWSMIALHLQRAALALERCVEVKKKPEVSAEPHAVQL
jgi:hypothetical protein